MKKNNGFTLVELMIVVAIIGILSAIAVPNFKKYQAKSKTTEAKLQLAAAYTAEQAFFGDYNIYARCLRYMGYDPRSEKSQRHYAVGISGLGGIHAVAFTSAVSLGLNGSAYASGGCQNSTGLADYTFFFAGRGVGSSIIDPSVGYSTSGSGVAASDWLGHQGDASNMFFTVAAGGVISADYTSGSDCSSLSIDENKKISVIRNGY